jgi:hypothetical protein
MARGSETTYSKLFRAYHQLDIGRNTIGAVIARGGITCTKTGKNCWLLSKAAKGSTGWQRN